MTRYTDASRMSRRAERREMPAIWRGIGCLMILFIPLLSWGLASLIMQLAVDQKWPIPYQLVGLPILPPDLLKVTALAPLWNFIQSQENLYGLVLFTILFIVAIGAAVSFVYAAVYRVVGPPTYGPLDAPPPRIKAKRYKR